MPTPFPVDIVRQNRRKTERLQTRNPIEGRLKVGGLQTTPSEFPLDTPKYHTKRMTISVAGLQHFNQRSQSTSRKDDEGSQIRFLTWFRKSHTAGRFAELALTRHIHLMRGRNPDSADRNQALAPQVRSIKARRQSGVSTSSNTTSSHKRIMKDCLFIDLFSFLINYSVSFRARGLWETPDENDGRSTNSVHNTLSRSELLNDYSNE